MIFIFSRFRTFCPSAVFLGLALIRSLEIKHVQPLVGFHKKRFPKQLSFRHSPHLIHKTTTEISGSHPGKCKPWIIFMMSPVLSPPAEITPGLHGDMFVIIRGRRRTGRVNEDRLVTKTHTWRHSTDPWNQIPPLFITLFIIPIRRMSSFCLLYGLKHRWSKI